MRTAALMLLAGLALPCASLATPELPSIPNLGQSGHDVTLPDVVFDHFPPTIPGGPPTASFTASIPEAAPAGGPPADHGSLPHDGTPPYGNAYGYQHGQGNGSTPSVPEPATGWMLAVGLAGLVAAGRRRA